MSTGLNIRKDGALDFLSLGALVHRLDPGIIPFRKATECDIHVSGGEFNCAANLSDCFRLNTGIATAMVDYPIGDLIAERVRAMGVKPFYKTVQARRRERPEHGDGLQRSRPRRARPGRVLQPLPTKRRRNAEARRFQLEGNLRRRRALVPLAAGIFAALSPTTAELIIEAHAGRESRGRDYVRSI